MNALPDFLIEPIVRRALEEDLGVAGDVTAQLVPDKAMKAYFRLRQPGVIAGLQPARLACALVNGNIRFKPLVEDGARGFAGDVIAEIEGPAGAVLTAERTALNFLTHLSGVATLTAAFVKGVEGTGAKIAGTRKTLPGLRALQKQALIAGGAWPHRYGLNDAILIKDNHIAAAGGVAEAMKRAWAHAGHMLALEVEVDSLTQLEQALPLQPHAVLLDNFSLGDLRAAVALAGGKTILEASGGVTLESVRAIAETGVNVISAGALTHSAPALDVGLDAD